MSNLNAAVQQNEIINSNSALSHHHHNHSQSQFQQPVASVRNLTQRTVSFSPKKCFICLSVFEFNDQEYEMIKKYFLDRNLILTCKFKTCMNKMGLVVILNKFVLSICKCKKKLAHLDCFNNYVDIKQNGNINISIVCPQCGHEYNFIYPYNSMLINSI